MRHMLSYPDNVALHPGDLHCTVNPDVLAMALGGSEGITRIAYLCPQRTRLGAHAAPRFHSHGLALSPQ